MKRVSQFGAVVVRRDEHGSRVLLVRAKKSPDAWIFPKGHVEFGESPEDTALREACEETGIRGVVIGAVGAPLEFVSGDEPVSVQYYLIYARSDCGSPEGRETQWCSFSEALQKLTHNDARALLASVESDITWWTTPRVSRPDVDTFTQLMVAEFNHIGESLLRNEESGEKRVAFFLTFAGGVGTAVGFLAGKDGPLHDQSQVLVTVTLLVLLLVGYSTFLRVVVRNAASDLYKRRLSRVRQYFLQGVDDPRRYFMTFAPFEHSWRTPSSGKSLGLGGWLGTMAVVEAIVGGGLGAWVAAWPSQVPMLQLFLTRLLVGLIVGGLVWWGLIKRGNVLYVKQMTKRTIRIGYEP
jgi:8-oxo-dGTP pyrophosphatase MutT (NUDIX family)